MLPSQHFFSETPKKESRQNCQRMYASSTTLGRQFFSVQLDVINGWKNFVEVFWRRKKEQGICFWVKLFECLQKKNTDVE